MTDVIKAETCKVLIMGRYMATRQGRLKRHKLPNHRSDTLLLIISNAFENYKVKTCDTEVSWANMYLNLSGSHAPIWQQNVAKQVKNDPSLSYNGPHMKFKILPFPSLDQERDGNIHDSMKLKCYNLHKLKSRSFSCSIQILGWHENTIIDMIHEIFPSSLKMKVQPTTLQIYCKEFTSTHGENPTIQVEQMGICITKEDEKEETPASWRRQGSTRKIHLPLLHLNARW